MFWLKQHVGTKGKVQIGQWRGRKKKGTQGRQKYAQYTSDGEVTLCV